MLQKLLNEFNHYILNQRLSISLVCVTYGTLARTKQKAHSVKLLIIIA